MSSPISSTCSVVNRWSLSRRPWDLARRAALTCLIGLVLGATSGCTAVGEGPAPDPVVDMSHPGDLVMVTPPMCTPKNCRGCCQNDVCQTGVTFDACGTAGAACAVCSDTQTCDTNFTCTANQNIVWLVASVEATIAHTNPLSTPASGMPWRTDGSLPRPLVQYAGTDRLAASDIVVSGTAPNQVWTVTWGSGFTYLAKDLLTTGLKLQLFDQVTPTTTQPISGVHTITFSQQDFTTKKLTFQSWEGALTFTVVLQRR